MSEMPTNKNDTKPMAQPAVPAMPIMGDDHVGKMYTQIARVHSDLVQAKWRIRNTPKGQIRFDPGPMMMHCEESIAFLAEQVLQLHVTIDKLPGLLDESLKEAVNKLVET